MHQAALLEAVQAQVVFKANVVDPAADATLLAVGDTDNAQGAWVTVAVTEPRPETVTVMVAVLVVHVVLAV